MAVNKALVGGLIVVGVVVGGLVAWTLLGNNVETKVTLGNSPCAVTAKQAEVTVGKGKKVTWQITNTCATSEVASVGNFRPKGTVGAADCSLGNDWPFKNTDREVTIPAGGYGEIPLKEAKNTTGAKRELDYDFCLGGVKKDPRLIIDP